VPPARPTRSARERAFFVFFLCSGFCGLLYEVVWTRLALASFGVTTTIVSVVLSVFMLGLALGAWASGAGGPMRRLGTGRRFLRAYALVELGIGTGAFAIPFLFAIERELLLGIAETNSQIYHLLSAVLLSLAALPWATLLGATYALAMGALRAAAATEGGDPHESSFSYLYVANVLGATLGTVVTALVLIEVAGFRGTLAVAAAVNATIAVFAWRLARDPAFAGAVEIAPDPREAPVAAEAQPRSTHPFEGNGALAILFITGFVSMAMELVWTRLFSYQLGTFVYAFAIILAAYLLATYFGSRAYRRAVDAGRRGRAEIVCMLLGGMSLLPLLSADPRLGPRSLTDGYVRNPWVILGIVPLCVGLGYLTPMLVDRFGGGHPGRAARAYGVNVLGCILGPLLAGYVLLPNLGERSSLVLLAVALLLMGLWTLVRLRGPASPRGLAAAFVASAGALAVLGGLCQTYVDGVGPPAQMRRDTTATIIASGTGMTKGLLVNGVGITVLTTVTKVMAHLPLALVPEPHRALVICFGMGTTFRSLASWGIDVTAVELVPSIPKMFGFFFADADKVLSSPLVHIEIDDGRRFLDRTRESFDVVTLDPPPPMAAAGSSMLYSRELYQAVKRRLAPRGVLQQWVWSEDKLIVAAAARALKDEFPYVVAYRSSVGIGLHFLASMEPISVPSGSALAARLPPLARADLAEWLEGGQTPEALFTALLGKPLSVNDLIAACPGAPALTDDHPLNEYFLLRLLFGGSCH
jgi:spermidine synthase